MEILSVTPRRKHLVCVKLDETECLIDCSTAERYGLKAGMVVSDEELYEIQYHSELDRARSRASWLLSMKDYSARDLASKLYKDFQKEAVDEAICELLDAGAIDDRRFAEVYARELSEIRAMSRQNIRRELYKKGISREIINDIVEELPEDEIPAIMDQIRLRYAGCFDDEKGYRRMVAGLARRGYSFGDIKKAIREYTEEFEDEE